MSAFLPKDFPLFRPAGAGSPQAAAWLTRLSINELVPSLRALSSIKTPQVISEPSGTDALRSLSRTLANRFESEGSDKARHGYDRLYARLFADLKPSKILESGLGTNNLRVPSNMGAEGSPGASLRAFQKVFPKLEVIGADVDKESLLGHDFPCVFLDQLSLQTFPESGSLGTVDLVIDDGLHMPAANINTVAWALEYSPQIHTVVVEDVPDSALPVWDVVNALIAPLRSCRVFRGATANAIVVAPVRYAHSL